ncbi:MAG: asparaginase [Rhizobiales bacterium]|nr:asparaginase [Rhizobacter sp.]
MQKKAPHVVVLGTGGTIAGTAANAADNVGYSAAQLGASDLVAANPALAGMSIEIEQVAQVDSKDIGFAIWRALAVTVDKHLARAEVDGIVIAHGTDTLEETAYFLQRVLAPAKPVVMVAAMRPATSLQADGPQNLLDAMVVAHEPGARGVVAVLAGKVHSALDVRKVHPYRLDAFGSGDAGAVAHVEAGRLRRHREWPMCESIAMARLPRDAAQWPAVEIVTSHAGARGVFVRALCEAGVQGIVVASTGNGSVHHELEAALLAAQAGGVMVLRSTRCLDGGVIDATDSAGVALPSAGVLTPVQARVELILRLLEREPG